MIKAICIYKKLKAAIGKNDEGFVLSELFHEARGLILTNLYFLFVYKPPRS